MEGVAFDSTHIIPEDSEGLPSEWLSSSLLRYMMEEEWGPVKKE